MIDLTYLPLSHRGPNRGRRLLTAPIGCLDFDQDCFGNPVDRYRSVDIEERHHVPKLKKSEGELYWERKQLAEERAFAESERNRLIAARLAQIMG